MPMVAENLTSQPHADDAAHATRQGELHCVIRSDTFSKSPRLAALLTYICERTWSGHTDELSEQQVGIHFFHRQPGFNASEDAIVRGSARHLRKRLELYYETEGKHNAYRITVPKGGYVARFEEAPVAASAAQAAEPVPEGAAYGDEARPHAPLRWQRFALPAAAVFLLAAVAVAAALLRESSRSRQDESYGPPALWATLFRTGKRTVLVPGDPNLNLYTAYVHHGVTLHEYNEQQYQHDPLIRAVSPEGPGDLTMVDATTMADTKFISELVRVPYREKLPIADRNVEVRFARDVNEGDLHGANLVLLGAAAFNPWVSLYDKNLDFQMDRDYEHYAFRVVNRAPRGGEPAVFTRDSEEVLTLIALTEAATDHEHVLLVEASRMGGIYGADNFLSTEKMWKPVIDAATFNGKLHNFEVVLKSNFLKDEVSNTRVVAWHVH